MGEAQSLTIGAMLCLLIKFLYYVIIITRNNGSHYNIFIQVYDILWSHSPQDTLSSILCFLRQLETIPCCSHLGLFVLFYIFLRQGFFV